MQEARASRSIQHSAVVPITDVVESETGELALVMELLHGEPLSARAKPMTVQETAAVLVPVTEALEAAHRAGFVHRDVKPGNIFLTRSGQVKLLDFGIAKRIVVDEANAHSIGTKTGALLGTPLYMSPEQAFGDPDIDRRTDVWSLGLVLYECLTGVLPTRSANVCQTLKVILTTEFPSVASHAPELPPTLSELVDRMLERQRDLRPGTQEIAAALAAAADPSGRVILRVGESDSSDR